MFNLRSRWLTPRAWIYHFYRNYAPFNSIAIFDCQERREESSLDVRFGIWTWLRRGRSNVGRCNERSLLQMCNDKWTRRGRRNGLPLDEEFIRYPSKPVLKSLNANSKSRFRGGGRFSSQVKTWPLCQFNPKFPRKHIFRLITQLPDNPLRLHIRIPGLNKSEEGLTARVSISPGKIRRWQIRLFYQLTWNRKEQDV